MDDPKRSAGGDNILDLRDQLSGTDELTGLLSRKGFTDAADEALGRLEPDRRLAAVIFDIDGFLTLNYALGPDVGDAILRGVAERLRDIADGRPVARLGADAFAVLVPESGDVDLLIRRARTAFGQPLPVTGQRLYVTVAAGAAFAEAGSTTDAMQLIAEAGAASLAAQEQGRGGWTVYQPTQREAVLERMEAEQEPNQAFHDDELTVRYQPKIDLTDGSIVGAEALLRWETGGGEVRTPPSFINIAEGSGLIVPIGLWVVDVAMRRLADWHGRLGRDDLHVSLNLSAHQLAQPTLVDDLWAAMLTTGIEPHQVEVEITETVLLQKIALTSNSLHQLRSLGIRVAVDDFGTGYASLNYLRQFPIDVLKIDKEFIAGLGQRQHDDVIVDAVVKLAHDLGLQVVAEGVETSEQLERLRELGCQYAQGFLIAPALDSPALLDLLADGPTW